MELLQVDPLGRFLTAIEIGADDGIPRLRFWDLATGVPLAGAVFSVDRKVSVREPDVRSTGESETKPVGPSPEPRGELTLGIVGGDLNITADAIIVLR